LFSASNGTPLRRSNFRRQVWQPALAAVGLPRDVHFHNLRGFTASLLIDSQATPLEVSAVLRHARPSITLDRYAKRFRRAAERTDAMLDEGLFGGSWGTSGVQEQS
jgi:integrase